MATNQLKVGDRVTYADLNLRNYRGTILRIGPQRIPGADCLVDWGNDIHGCECLRHLFREAQADRDDY